MYQDTDFVAVTVYGFSSARLGKHLAPKTKKSFRTECNAREKSKIQQGDFSVAPLLRNDHGEPEASFQNDRFYTTGVSPLFLFPTL